MRKVLRRSEGAASAVVEGVADAAMGRGRQVESSGWQVVRGEGRLAAIPDLENGKCHCACQALTRWATFCRACSASYRELSFGFEFDFVG